MAATFDRATDETVDILNRTVERFHKELNDYSVRIGLIMAFGPRDEAGNLKRTAIQRNGVPCAGQVRIVGLKDRLLKQLDVEVLLDGDYWETIDEPKKIAIIDHELEHIVPVLDKKTNKIKLDDLERPKLKLKRDDINWWGIAKIAERHGIDSQEVLGYQQLTNKYGNILSPPQIHKER